MSADVPAGGAGLSLPCLMLVTDRTLCADLDELVQAAVEAVAGGVSAVQVREKDLPEQDQADLARRLVRTVGARATVLVNDRPTIALEAGAGGIHGGEGSLAPGAVRRATRGRLLIGRSVHSIAGAVEAAAAGADYLVLGTIFPSRSHPGGETGGLARIAEVRAAVAVPLIAIGGITPANAPDAIRAGADGIAVISAILGQPDPRSAAAALRAAIDNAYAVVAGTSGAR